MATQFKRGDKVRITCLKGVFVKTVDDCSLEDDGWHLYFTDGTKYIQSEDFGKVEVI